MKEKAFNDSLELVRQLREMLTGTDRQLHQEEMSHYNVKKPVGWNELSPRWFYKITALSRRKN